jgi:hypothetical protein
VAASEGAAAGLLESTVSLAGVRALVSYVVPHLVQAELSAGFAATVEEGADGRLDWHELGVATAAGFAGSAGAARAGRIYHSVRFAKKAWPLLHLVMPHVAEGAAFAGADAAEQATDGSDFSLREMLLAGGSAAVGAAVPNVRVAPKHVAKALSRQTPDEMLSRGVDLTRHEAIGLGHTMTKHVVDRDFLSARIAGGMPRAGRFFDLGRADDAVTEVLRAHADDVRRFAAGTDRRLQLLGDVPGAGEVMTASGRVEAANAVVVVLMRNADGIYIKTAFPELLP